MSFLGCNFGLQMEASCLQWSFLLTVVFGSFFAYRSSVFYLQLELSLLQLKLFAYSGKVLLASSSTACKQRSSTVSKQSPTVSYKRLLPNFAFRSCINIASKKLKSALPNPSLWVLSTDPSTSSLHCLAEYQVQMECSFWALPLMPGQESSGTMLNTSSNLRSDK